jgi:hypothetical protein
MHLTLDSNELEILQELVSEAIRELGPEIHHTDARDYRAMLEDRRRTLRNLQQRLGQISDSVGTAAR